MSDEKTVQPDLAESPDLAPGRASGAEQAKLFADGQPKKHTGTFGKRMHWWITYAGADWILNSAIGVAFAFWGARFSSGQRFYSKPAEKVFGTLFSPFVKNEAALVKWVSGGKDFLSIMLGGTLVNPVIKRLESHQTKKSVAKFFDRMMHGKFAVENDPYFQRAYAEIDREPRKDMRGVWISRAMAIVPLWALASWPRSRDFMRSNQWPVIKYINFDHIANFSKGVAGKLRIQPGKWMLQKQVDKTSGQLISNWDALHGYIGFDYGLTIFYALLHALSFGLVAKKLERRTEIREILQEYKREHPRSEPAGTPYASMEQLDRIEEKPDAPGLKISGVESKARLGERGVQEGLQA